MYSVVLMTALTTGGSAADFHWRRSWCNGGCYCSGYSACHGCHGGHWGYGCGGIPMGNGAYNIYRCYGCATFGAYGCYCSGGYGAGWWGTPYGCHGCYGGTMNWSCYSCSCFGDVIPAPYLAPPIVTPNGGTPPTPKQEQPKKDGDGKSGQTEVSVRATLVVELPEDAQLFVDGVKMKSTSERRIFTTPELEPGRTYFYDLRAEMNRDGQPISVTGRVIIRPGQEVTARLTSPTPDGTFLVSTDNR